MSVSSTAPSCVLLPVVRPGVVSYLHHANYLAVAETDPRARSCLLNHFLQLYSRENHAPAIGRELLVDFYSCDGMYPRYPYLANAYLSAARLACLGGDPLAQVCALLDSGAYVMPTLDESRMSAKAAYGKDRYPHPNLIHGHDRDRARLYAIGFNRDLDFARFEIGFDEFRAAFGADAGLSVLTLEGSPDYTNSQPFSPEFVRACLEDFVHGRCRFAQFRPPGSAFGRACYDVAIAKVEQDNAARIDIRPWCVFHEHKQRLQLLCRHLRHERGCDLAPAIDAGLAQLEADFYELRNYLLQALLDDREVRIAALRRNVDTITDAEAALVGALIDALTGLR
jgi:hypothetical protein